MQSKPYLPSIHQKAGGDIGTLEKTSGGALMRRTAAVMISTSVQHQPDKYQYAATLPVFLLFAGIGVWRFVAFQSRFTASADFAAFVNNQQFNNTNIIHILHFPNHAARAQDYTATLKSCIRWFHARFCRWFLGSTLNLRCPRRLALCNQSDMELTR